MKKIVSAIVAMTLVLAMSIGVCAAPSVNKLPTTSAGTVTNTSAAYVQQSKEAAGGKVDGYSAVTYFNATSDKNGEITFDVPGLKDGDKVIAMYKCPIHGWTEVSATVVNGKVTLNFACCATVNGPVVIWVKTTASPKTADAGLTTAAVVAMIAIAGLVISKKKFA